MKKVINENTIKQMVREALAEVFGLSQASINENKKKQNINKIY